MSHRRAQGPPCPRTWCGLDTDEQAFLSAGNLAPKLSLFPRSPYLPGVLLSCLKPDDSCIWMLNPKASSSKTSSPKLSSNRRGLCPPRSCSKFGGSLLEVGVSEELVLILTPSFTAWFLHLWNGNNTELRELVKEEKGWSTPVTVNQRNTDMFAAISKEDSKFTCQTGGSWISLPELSC